MSEPLVFLMGKHPAPLPADRLYCRNHMWCQDTGGGVLRFGFSAYAVRLMDDVYFLEWSVNPGDALALKQAIGNIETKKATSELFAPLAGELVGFNDEVLADPSAINADPYGDGWLFELRADASGAMFAAGYHEHLAATWDATQRILKGQMGD